MFSLTILMLFAGVLFAIPLIFIVLSLLERWNINRK